MAPSKDKTPSFDAIIQADRQKRKEEAQKKKNEALANEILTKNRRASAPGVAGNKKKKIAAVGGPGSLASRVGVVNRSVSAPLKKSNTAPAASTTTKNRQVPASKRRPHEDRLFAAVHAENGQANVRKAKNTGFSIKGAGSTGPYIVLGSNFAPGTTAADIQSALEPVGGEIVSCRITSQAPTVTAEIAFTEKSGAESVVANFHNQKADGRILSMKLKSTRSDLFSQTSTTNSSNAYDGYREQADHQRREQRKHGGAEPQIQDGSFGFNERNNNAARKEKGRGGRASAANNRSQQQSGLYSDEMMVDAPAAPSKGGSRRGRGRG